MKGKVLAVGLSAVMAITSAMAHPESAATIAKQQLTACMNRQMASSRTVSYNEAMRSCKAKLQPPKDTLASNATNPSEGKAP